MPMNNTATPLDGEQMYAQAEAIARKAHAPQTRRDGVTPYFDHVKEVADSLQGWDLKTVGILHDTLEDTSVTAASLRALGFPDRIVRAVEAMTKPAGANYLEYVRDQVKQNPLARLVKLADLAANLKNNDRADQVAKYTSAQIILQNE